MVDTTENVIYLKATTESFDTPTNIAVSNFLTYLDKKLPPSPNYGDYENSTKYFEKYNEWSEGKFTLLDSLYKNDPKFINLYNTAFFEVKKTGKNAAILEEYVRQYGSKSDLLEIKINMLVYGSCSQDQSPRIHAMEIAILSAETTNWEVFLRAHLNIMNDRFQRASDGSYAWARRKTYIKELEELEIDARSLLLGMSLRIENSSQNHYYGNISRLGRALSETQYSDEIETTMLKMIKNPLLDDYNRILIFYLFQNYIYYIDDEKKPEKRKILKETIKTLPTYIVEGIDKD